MNRLLSNLITSSLLIGFASNPCNSQSQVDQAPAFPTASQLAEKAQLIEKSHHITAPGFAQSPSLPSQAAEIARQIDVLVVDIQAAWLVRNLDAVPLPNDMKDRLSSRGTAVQTKIVASLTSLFEFTLLDKFPFPKSQVRVTQVPKQLNDESSGKTKTNFLKQKANRQLINNYTQDNISLKIQFMQRDNFIELYLPTSDQLTLIRRLDELARSALRFWAQENLTASEIPGVWSPRPVQLRQQISDISDSIVFGAILSAEQSEKFKRAYWTIRGLRSLIDPELAARLGIGREQRVLIERALNNVTEATKGLRLKQRSLFSDLGNKDTQTLKSQYKEMIQQATRDAEQGVWDLLTPKQISLIKSMLGDRALRPDIPVQKQRHKSSLPSKNDIIED